MRPKGTFIQDLGVGPLCICDTHHKTPPHINEQSVPTSVTNTPALSLLPVDPHLQRLPTLNCIYEEIIHFPIEIFINDV